ncbi:MAG: hypothetical protein LBH53_01365 [Puniceicoccales bacterium]|nr:hypothetical protein [Puniceicoccales bacterium]
MAMKNGAPRPVFYDRLLLFFSRNGRSISIGLLLLIFVALTFGCRAVFRHFHLARAQNHFAATQNDSGELAAFADRFGDLPLGALASYGTAASAMGRGDFAAATISYGRCKALASARLDGFAALAGALALARSGELQESTKRLTAVALDGAQPSIVRAGARYFQALLAREAGQMALACEALEALSQLPERGDWEKKAAVLSLP